MSDYKPPLRRFIEENFLMDSRGTQLADADSFMARHIVDSTGFLELVMFIEETWNVKVEDDDMVPENLDSLDALQRFLTRKIGS